MNFRKWLLALIVTISIGYGTTTESSGEHSLGDEEELHNGNVLQPGAEQTTDISVLSSYLQAMMVKSERNVDPFKTLKQMCGALEQLTDAWENLVSLVQQDKGAPLRANVIDVSPNAEWKHAGVTVAGQGGSGRRISQLNQPLGLYVAEDQTVYVAEWANHRVVEWKWNAKSGRVVAGGNGHGTGNHQLTNPRDVVLDKQTDSLVICDRTNRRVVRWPLRQGSVGETLIANIHCWGLTMDSYGSIYVSDEQKHVVLRYGRGESQGTVVAGGNGGGSGLNQLNTPTGVFVDHDQTVYVAEIGNNRVTKWVKGTKEASIVAGGHGKGNNATQLAAPEGIVVDQLGTVYIADKENDRIMRWSKDATEGTVVAGGNSRGEQANQLHSPIGLSFDYFGNLYVAELDNQRVQRFNLQSTFNVTYHQTYELVHVASNKSIDIVFDGTNYGPAVQLFRSHGGDNQRWLIYLYVGGSIQFFNEKTQKALDVRYSRTEDGSGLQVHPNNMSGAQRWHLEPVGGDVYELIGVSSGKALSAGGSGTSDNAKLEIRTRDGSLAQKWRFVRRSP